MVALTAHVLSVSANFDYSSIGALPLNDITDI